MCRRSLGPVALPIPVRISVHDTSPEELAAQYAQMSETELMELARSYDGLLAIAQVVLRAEFARRGLEPALVEEPEEPEIRRLVTVRRYRDLMEAFLGRSLLESAGIQSWIADENLVLLMNGGWRSAGRSALNDDNIRLSITAIRARGPHPARSTGENSDAP